MALDIRKQLNETLWERGSLIDYKAARMIGNAVAASFLSVHIVMLILFWATGVRPMAILNVFSVAFYIFCFYLNYKAKFREFVLFALIEVLLHMTAAVYYTGWENGFQITLVGITLMLVISEYLGRMMDTERLPSFVLCGLCMFTYLAEYVISFFHEAPYTLPLTVTFGLNIGLAVITFSISVGSMISFVWLTASTEDMLAERAMNDRLTGLNNRSGIMKSLENAGKERGFSGRWAAMADIDDFKKINDTYGHLCGDYVLKTIADIMNSCNVDALLSRWGGEEFLIIGYTDGDMGIHIARLENFRQKIEDHEFRYDDHTFRVTITIGVAEYRPGASLEEWIREADEMLYKGKRSGKNRVEWKH